MQKIKIFSILIIIASICFAEEKPFKVYGIVKKNGVKKIYEDYYKDEVHSGDVIHYAFYIKNISKNILTLDYISDCIINGSPAPAHDRIEIPPGDSFEVFDGTFSYNPEGYRTYYNCSVCAWTRGTWVSDCFTLECLVDGKVMIRIFDAICEAEKIKGETYTVPSYFHTDTFSLATYKKLNFVFIGRAQGYVEKLSDSIIKKYIPGDIMIKNVKTGKIDTLSPKSSGEHYVVLITYPWKLEKSGKYEIIYKGDFPLKPSLTSFVVIREDIETLRKRERQKKFAGPEEKRKNYLKKILELDWEKNAKGVQENLKYFILYSLYTDSMDLREEVYYALGDIKDTNLIPLIKKAYKDIESFPVYLPIGNAYSYAIGEREKESFEVRKDISELAGRKDTSYLLSQVNKVKKLYEKAIIWAALVRLKKKGAKEKLYSILEEMERKDINEVKSVITEYGMLEAIDFIVEKIKNKKNEKLYLKVLLDLLPEFFRPKHGTEGGIGYIIMPVGPPPEYKHIYKELKVNLKEFLSSQDEYISFRSAFLLYHLLEIFKK